MKRRLLKLAGLAVAAVAAALLVAWSGLVPIAASSGHWPITAWFLHFTMRQSVETHSLGIAVPPLDDPALILRGAGHYDSGCAPCHGAPGTPRSEIARQMTPHPPYLPPRIPEWEPQELFWIVKHGVKFTGMPAWPAQQREDEVWAMVAFLQRLPELSPQAYRRLAHNPPVSEAAGGGAARLRTLQDPLGAVLESCARCHGVDGMGRGVGAFPRLADQTEVYLFASLRAFAAGERFSGIMQPIASGLDEATMRALAGYYADRVVGRPAAPPVDDPEALARGAAIATRGIPAQGVPACVHCHGPKEAPRHPLYPILAGQYPEYLVLQLELFREGRRGGTPFAHIMRTIADRLTPEQMREVALFFASLGGEGEVSAR